MSAPSEAHPEAAGVLGARFFPQSIRLPQLLPARDAEQFALHMAALEWSLHAPITIRTEADIQSARSWADRVKPYRHQIQNLMTFCRRAPVALLADDVGLGKTISAGLILSELMARRKVSRVLVVAPSLLLPQWREELYEKFNIAALEATGASLARSLDSSVPVVISTYQSVRSTLDKIRAANFDMIILDEAHKLRNLHGTSSPPLFAQAVRQALADRVFKYALMLTATPIQNRLWDLYSLVDLLTAAKGHANPLGSPEVFRVRFVADARGVQLKQGRKEEFRRILSSYIVRTRRCDASLLFPKRKVVTQRIGARAMEQELLRLVSGAFKNARMNGLSLSSVGQALMSSPEALALQVERMAANGTFPAATAASIKAVVRDGGRSAKLDALCQLISQLSAARPNDWRVVVFTSRSETQAAIGKQLKAMGIRFGFISGQSREANNRTVHGFKQVPPAHNVIVSTDAGAEGVNLQSGNVLVNYDLPWNPMVLEQRIGRIQRLASSHAEVHVLNFVLAGSVEERVVGLLLEKLQAVAESLGDIEGILEATGSELDSAESFEAKIRTLVVESMRGQDVEEATRLAAESITAAQRIYEEERQTVEQTLGDLRDMHRVGPSVPEIAPLTPSMEPRELVVRSFEADGGRLREVKAGILGVTLPGHNEFRISFDERHVDETDQNHVFSGNTPRLYAPGKRDFERLTQSWSDKAGALVAERTAHSADLLEKLVSDWIANLAGLAVHSLKDEQRHTRFQGRLVCRGSVAVAHDRLEKLFPLDVRSEQVPEVRPPEADERYASASFDPTRLPIGAADSVKEGMATEPDLNKFCTFYQERLKEELAATQTAQERASIIERYTPAAAADAVAVSGVLFEECVVSVQVLIDGTGPYPCAMRIIPDALHPTDVVRPDSPWFECEESGRSVPQSAVAGCAVTGKRVLRSLLTTCEATSQLALTGSLVTCALTGKRVVPSALARSVVSGAFAIRSEMAKSSVSGRLALPTETLTCALTGGTLLPDEAATSEVSQRIFRADQQAISVLSKRVGHVSEFIKSLHPRGLIAVDEAGTSDLSGESGDQTLLCRSELPPFRQGWPEEFVACGQTGRQLLRDEVDASSVSGKLVEKSLLVQSATGAGKALPEELVICGRSGARLLPKEVGRCGVSGLQIDLRLLAPSSISGRLAAKDLLVSCAVSGSLALPEELVRCSVCDQMVLPTLTRKCAITGRTALATRMRHSEFSQSWYIPDAKSQAVLKARTGLDSLFTRCNWYGVDTLSTDVGTCVLSGLVFDRRVLNQRGELAVLRLLLDGVEVPGAEPLPPKALEWLASQDPEFKAVDQSAFVLSMDRKSAFAAARCRKGFLGLNSKVAALGFSAGSVPRLLFRPLFGKRSGGNWAPVA